MKRCSAILVLVAGLVACTSGIRIDNDYDPSASFAAYKTYTWYPTEQQVPPDAYVSELVVGRIEAAIRDGMALKGMTAASGGQADFQVRTHLVVEDKLDVQTWNASYGYRSYRDPWGWSMGTETTVTQYKQGTLIVDFLDAKTGKLFWRGTAETRLRRDQSPAEREARIREVVQALLSQYPPAKSQH